MRHVVVPVLASIVAGSLLTGCPDRTLSEVNPIRDPVETKAIPVKLNRDLDLLFVIDNSGSMSEEQTSLRANFPAFINVLNTIEGGLPNIRIGVISTNVGTGGVNIGGCSTATKPQGDDGLLLTNGCPGLTAAFIEDIGLDNGNRQRNYSGQLADVFGCMANLGTSGCGFEQPLESIFRALQPNKNPGFLRDNAFLGVVIISDEDDCSAKGPELFGDATASNTSVLGPRTSFRCFEHGITCANDPNPRAFGTKTGCEPKVGSQYMKDIQPYVDYLKSLKADPKKVVVAGILGNVDDAKTAIVGADPDDATRAALQPSCTSASGEAVPEFRTKAFLEQFPDRNSVTTICNDQLSDALTDIAELLKKAIGNPCIENQLADQNPDLPGIQYECSVTDVTDPNGPNRSETVIPECALNGNTPPCWSFISDPMRCATAPDNRAVEVNRGNVTVPDDTVLQVQCVVEP
ncbi:MAG: VWA domain-containing protein [Kofleriaceae bacterium]